MSEQLSQQDLFAFMFLKEFIPAQFPGPEPEKQVHAAYYYAGLMVRCRESVITTPTNDKDAAVPKCNKCGGELRPIDLSSLDGPGVMLVCSKCGRKHGGPEPS